MPGRHNTEHGSASSMLVFTRVTCRRPAATALVLCLPGVCMSAPVPVDCQHELLYTRVDNQQETAAMAQTKHEVLPGTLNLLILKTLASLGELHGYGIARRIEQVSGDLLELNQG